ncbi:MAG: GatB/YqeY domain-containing protein [Desulfobulbaceae bacterium]|uniref:GatB/YqeY domain-containing protein n=1 Tax=Candidatus Desulfobia pelagia TaxID=2841692 RepID=A0A8J6NCN9_9BACT|nr:GatB/YqeY domain-containing protein [Candidatus Desulfobia pelagia]
MSLQEKIRSDLKDSMKAKDEARTSTLRILLGEFARQPQKVLQDQDVLAIVRKLVKSENETIAAGGTGSATYLEVLEGYLPQQASEDDIREWVTANIDFSQFKSKMQAMKPIMAHFAGTTGGNTVKKILEEIE